jgi:gamma-glutamyltranspeptidase/glutathione hydrolase
MTSRLLLRLSAFLAIGLLLSACGADPERAAAGAAAPDAAADQWFSHVPTGRSLVRAGQGMVASSQPLASQVGLDVLKRGGNAVDAAIAMAAVLSVTEPMMTGVGGDAFMLVYSAQTGRIEGLNASGRAPRALTVEHFKEKSLSSIPFTGMEAVTVPGAFDGWVTLLERHGTMRLADVLAPAIHYADNGFPLMEKAAEDWAAEVPRLKQTPVTSATFLVREPAPQPGELIVLKNLAATYRTLAAGGRDAFYRGPIARAIVEYSQQNGGFLTMEDFAAQRSEWVEPISTTYKGHTLYEIPPNGQGLTALIALNILEGIDLTSMRSQPDLYHHTMIEAMKLAFADRNRYIADPAFAATPVAELLSRDYAARRRALIDPAKAMDPPSPGDVPAGRDTTYLTVVDKDRNAVSFINSLFFAFGSGVVAGDTGIILQNRGAGFSLDPNHPNRLEPGKRPFHTIIPAMVFRDDKLLMSFGVMGGDVQPQGHVQVLVNMIDRGLNLQQAIDAPRTRYINGRSVMMEDALGTAVIDRLVARGHQRALPPAGYTHRALMGGGQAILIDPVTGALVGASDHRKDGLALGY